MWISKKEMMQLSEAIKASIDVCDGKNIERTEQNDFDIRDNREGAFCILKNDIYSLICKKNEQIAQLEAERDVLSKYMADISHQLKTPITSMLIMADLLENGAMDKQEEFLCNIKSSLLKMQWLVGALLKMAKLDAMEISFDKRNVRVSELLKSVLPSVEILLDVKNQSLHIEHDEEICCDKKWTVEAMTNIIKNAIEHSPNGSRLLIDSGNNPLYEWVSVTDCGEGMKKEHYAALFQRFAYSTTENGFGIGMPLALSIMRGQKGDIDVDFGGNGKGATFILKFYKA